MATSFRGWGTSWANSWGPIAVDPNAMIGAAGFSLTAIATLTSGVVPSDMSGSASLTFSAIGILTDPNAYPARRPKSNSSIKLVKIQDARVKALHGHASTRARAVQATGETRVTLAPQPVVVPAAAVVGPSCRKTRGHSVQASGVARSTVRTACAKTVANTQQAAATAHARLLSACVYTYTKETHACGGATTALRSATSTASAERVQARGVQRLSNAALAGIAVAVSRSLR